MSWYKKSKIINMESGSGMNEYLVCPKCGRWGANESGNFINNSEDNGDIYDIDWKYYYQMDQEEQRAIDASKKLADLGAIKYKTLICTICKPRRQEL